MSVGDRPYNRYDYLVATPYVGIRIFNKLEIVAGPEVSLLADSRLASGVNPRGRNPTQHVTGYNVQATYWLSRLGLEGGYSRQTTPFDSQQLPDVTYKFYNSYVYAGLKYNLIRQAR